MVLRRFTAGQTLMMLGLIAAALYGCGQKGKLYMPDQPPPHLQQQEDCRTPNCAAVLQPSEPTPAEQTSEEDEDTEQAVDKNTAEETTE